MQTWKRHQHHAHHTARLEPVGASATTDYLGPCSALAAAAGLSGMMFVGSPFAPCLFTCFSVVLHVFPTLNACFEQAGFIHKI
jgi:hypothetical protein